MADAVNIFGGTEQLPETEKVDGHVVQLTRRAFKPAAAPKPAPADILIAREAIARVEREGGWHGMAEHRLVGAYDNDEETSIALSVMTVLRERGLLIEPDEAA